MLWFLIGVGLAVVVVAVLDQLRQPYPTAEPPHRTRAPRGGDHPDWARAWDGPGGAGSHGSTGDGSAR